MNQASPLAAMQSTLAEFYELPTEFPVEDFLITDLARLGGQLHPTKPKTDEMIFVQETEHGIDVSLFLDEKILARLNDDDPHASLGRENLEAYLVALEGVSHFQYLVWNTIYQKSVTLFEMELQAEVDKYVATSMLLAKQRGGEIPNALHEHLFDSVCYRENLTPILLSRYQDANHYAGKYCQTLKNDYPGHHHERDFVVELRRFYRMPQNEKIHQIRHRE